MYAGDVYDWEYVLTAKNEFLQKAKKTYETLTLKKTKANATTSPNKSKVKINNQADEAKDLTLGSSKRY
jgi:hypothetical protein